MPPKQTIHPKDQYHVDTMWTADADSIIPASLPGALPQQDGAIQPG